MGKDPAVLFYTGDFLNGCTDLDFDERGQYITLLCLQHQKGHLSEKTIRLCVGSVSSDVLSKFKIDSAGNYFNKRMDEEIEKRQHFLDTRYFNGKKGGRPIKANSKPNKKANSKPKQNLPENENRNDNKYINDEELNSLFIDFLEMRKKIKKPATERAIELLLKDLNKINDKKGALELSIKKNYQGLFEPNKQSGNNGITEQDINSFLSKRD